MAYPRKVNLAVKTLEDRKGEEIEILNVQNLTPFADYYVVATAPNLRALGAFADHLDEAFEKDGDPIRRIEGKPESEWVIVDAGEIVIHLFTREKRQEIDLETLIKKANSKR